MKIIAIEGLDKSGKKSQTELLAQRLAALGLRVERSEFPRYDTPTGQLIGKWLRKEYDVDQSTIELISSADKQAQQVWFNQLEAEGVDILILDRYIGSQTAYSQSAGVPLSWTMEMQRYMRTASMTLLIDIPVSVSMTRQGKHNNGENDRYEADKDLLARVNEAYSVYMAYGEPYDKIFDGEQSVTALHEEIYDWVAAYLTDEGVI